MKETDRVYICCPNNNDVILELNSTQTILYRYFYKQSKWNDLLVIYIPDGIEEIAKSAFSNWTLISHVYLPDSIKIISDKAFENCINLEEVSVNRKYNHDNLEISLTTFDGCHNLRRISLPNFKPNDLFLKFTDCEKLEKVLLTNQNIEFNVKEYLDNHANNYLVMSLYYHEIGMDLSIIQGHSNAPNSFKSPLSVFLQNQLNTASVLFNQNWRKASGIGTCLGYNHLRAIDVDKIDDMCQVVSIDEDGEQYFDTIGGILPEILEKLGLPKDYPWVVESGSHEGFHVLFMTDDVEDVDDCIALTPNVNYCNGNNAPFFSPLFQRMELYWNGHIVLPPSIHISGNEYKFRQRQLPHTPPCKVPLSNLNDMLNHFCGQTVFKSYNFGKDIQLELVETIKTYSEYDSYGYIDLTNYKKDCIKWLEACDTPDTNNSLAIRYVTGEGVSSDKIKAFELFQKAGNTSHAWFNIASLIACGYFDGTSDDVEHYLQMCCDEETNITGWIVNGDNKLDLVRENAKNYTRKKTTYLFFDTETTGIPNNYNAPSSDIKNWPRLVQLAWILEDENGRVLYSGNTIVKPEGFVIPNDVSKIHGITTQKAIEVGVPLEDVIKEFEFFFNCATYVVGHNIDFDKKIVGAEMIRLGMKDIMDTKKSYCTMQTSIDFCKIPGSYGYKYPKLQELYKRLFGKEFDNAHNAMSDVEATEKCFWEMRKRKLI